MPVPLDRCIEHCADNFHWKEKYPVRDMGNGKVRAAGMALAMQGSCISNVDVGSCTLKLGDGGTYNMMIGAADMGTWMRYDPCTDGSGSARL